MANKHCEQCKSCIHSGLCYKESNRKVYTGSLKLTPCESYKPTADVVEVCRCKDCKYFYEDIYNGKVLQRECRLRSIGCGVGTVSLETDNGFCSYGEKRSDNK